MLSRRRRRRRRRRLVVTGPPHTADTDGPQRRHLSVHLTLPPLRLGQLPQLQPLRVSLDTGERQSQSCSRTTLINNQNNIFNKTTKLRLSYLFMQNSSISIPCRTIVESTNRREAAVVMQQYSAYKAPKPSIQQDHKVVIIILIATL